MEGNDFGGRLRDKSEKVTDWESLVDLVNERMAFIYQRLSTNEQVKKHIWSQEAQDNLVDLAHRDGYSHELIHLERRDLGISGTKGREEREGLAYLIELVEAGFVEAVYVVHISRLYRDQTLINALALGELFKEHGVIIVTPQMRLNLRDKMHMRLYRMEVERAADELELMSGRLFGARNLKAKSGRYAGESLPPGYVVDMRKELDNGDPNPEYDAFIVHEPHAKVVRAVFDQLSMPGATPTRVARQFRSDGIVFPPFPPGLDTPANRKSFSRSRKDAGGNWTVSIMRVRRIATNPAYIGWRIWEGELVNHDTYPPIVDEATFWAVQDLFNNDGAGHTVRPKKDNDPLPLAGLLNCANHDAPRPMSYTRGLPGYCCKDAELETSCWHVTGRILEDPVSEVVIGQIALPELAEEVLDKLTDEYERAREQAASWRREARRLDAEIEHLRANLAASVLSAENMAWIDAQIRERLERVRELSELESRPIGAVIGQPAPDAADVELVRSFLDNLEEEWPNQPDGLKNAFLRLLLDRIVLRTEPGKIRARIVWRVGLEQSIIIWRPQRGGRQPWSEEELDTLRAHYETAGKYELMDLLPGRTWRAIKTMGGQILGFSRAHKVGSGRAGTWYTPEEDELVRAFYAGEIRWEEVLAGVGRSMQSIRGRAERLGLHVGERIAWDWDRDFESGCPSTWMG